MQPEDQHEARLIDNDETDAELRSVFSRMASAAHPRFDPVLIALRRAISAFLIRGIPMRHLSTIFFLTALSAIVSPTLTRAQVAEELGEIVVTATKRSSTVQTTPMSITAIAGDQLGAAGASSVTDLVQRVPGLSFSSAGAGRSTYSIRGISSSAGSSPTVGFYLDEIPITPPTDTGAIGRSFVDPNLFDLDHVEVLRGPQGTLYGAGSMGGTIRLITGQPQFGVTKGTIELAPSYTDHGGANFAANAMVNIPIGDAVAIRIVGSSKKESGFIDTIIVSPFPVTTETQRGDVANAPVIETKRDANTLSQNGIRATIAIKPNDRLSVNLGALYQNIHQGAPDTIDSNPGNLARYAPFLLDENFRDRFQLYSANVMFDLGFASITSATGYLKRHILQGEDGTEYVSALLGTPTIPVQSYQTHDTKEFTEELRLTSQGSGPWQWIVGGFYSDFKSGYTSPTQAPGYLPILGTSNLATFDVSGSIRQHAFFGEATYKLTSRLSVTGGLRWYEFHQDSSLNSSGIIAPAPPFNIQDVSSQGSSTTPKASVNYTVNEDMLVFATYAKGSRVGGPNYQVAVSGPASCADGLATLGMSNVPGQFKGDTVDSFETGVKTQWFDKHLTVNASGFYINWSDIQQQVRIPGCGRSFTDNLGKAVSKGFDLDIQTKLGDHVRLGGSVGYTNAKLTESITGVATSGDRIQNTPRWTSGQWVELSYPINGSWTAIMGVKNDFYGSSVDVLGSRAAYDLLGANLGFSREGIEVEVFANNITDERADLQNTLSQMINISAYNRVAINRPRTIGVSVSYRF